jgi:hypothetical protein
LPKNPLFLQVLTRFEADHTAKAINATAVTTIFLMVLSLTGRFHLRVGSGWRVGPSGLDGGCGLVGGGCRDGSGSRGDMK